MPIGISGSPIRGKAEFAERRQCRVAGYRAFKIPAVANVSASAQSLNGRGFGKPATSKPHTFRHPACGRNRLFGVPENTPLTDFSNA